MPARKAVELIEGDVKLSFSVRGGESSVVLSFSTTDGEHLVKIPTNDFKDFLAMLETLKASLVTPIHCSKGN